LFELGHDVLERRPPDTVARIPLDLDLVRERAVADQGLERNTDVARHPFDQGVALGVYRGAIERMLTAAHAQKAGRLLEGLRPEPGHPKERRPSRERALLIAMLHDLLRERGTDAGDVLKERGARGVELDADVVHAALHDLVELSREHRLVDVVLILADPD